MSHSAHALLVYGADLGDGDCIPVPDTDEPLLDEDGNEVCGDVGAAHYYAVQRLCRYIPDGLPALGREPAIRKHFGIRFEWRGTDGYPLLLMVLDAYDVTPGEVMKIDLDAMKYDVRTARFEERIRAALVMIDVKPDDVQFGWLLAAYQE